MENNKSSAFEWNLSNSSCNGFLGFKSIFSLENSCGIVNEIWRTHVLIIHCYVWKYKYLVEKRLRKFNTPINSQIFNEAIERMIKELNLMQSNLEQIEKFGGHTFRHTFATRCIESGIQPKTLQKYLGHATLQMTMDLYVHTTDEHKHEEMKKLEDSTERICSDSKSVDEKFENLIKENDKIIKFTLGA